ncbi:hypothetical protein cand_013180 [Cryptosporidium andersoni]|uniref:Peroxisome assembly protein 22 n=1 Tax=Cryptosporidium andersoni TaxID=117008 RepID=A0A1J4MG13_9CRYT|nr:hypothetical protein cand_013180 [Cryptosporidium andersoni]
MANRRNNDRNSVGWESESSKTSVIVWTCIIATLFIIKYIYQLLFDNSFRTSNIGNEIGSRDGIDRNKNRASALKISMGLCFGKDHKFFNSTRISAILTKLCLKADIYLIVQVNNDEEESVFMKTIEDMGILDNGLKRHRIVFCEKSTSIPSLARQLQPLMHIDTNKSHLDLLSGKVPNVIYFEFDDNGQRFEECVDNINYVAGVI